MATIIIPSDIITLFPNIDYFKFIKIDFLKIKNWPKSKKDVLLKDNLWT